MSAPSGFDPSVSLLQQNASAPIQPFRGGGASLETFYQVILTRLSEAEREALPKKIKELTDFAISVKDGMFVLKMKVKGEKETEPLLSPESQKVVDIVTAAAKKAEQEATAAAVASRESAEIALRAAAKVAGPFPVPATSGLQSSSIYEGKTGESGEGSSTSGLQSSAISEATTAEAITLIAASEAVNQAKEVMEARKDAEILRKARDFLILEAARAFLKAETAKEGEEEEEGEEGKEEEEGKQEGDKRTRNINTTLRRQPLIKKRFNSPPRIRQDAVANAAAVELGKTQEAQQIRGRLTTPPVYPRSESKTGSPSPPPPPLSPPETKRKQGAIKQAENAFKIATDITENIERDLKKHNVNPDESKNSNNEATKALLKEIQKDILELNRVAGEVQTKSMKTKSTTTVTDAETAANTANKIAVSMIVNQHKLKDKIGQVARIRKKVVNNAVAPAKKLANKKNGIESTAAVQTNKSDRELRVLELTKKLQDFETKVSARRKKPGAPIKLTENEDNEYKSLLQGNYDILQNVDHYNSLTSKIESGRNNWGMPSSK